MKIKKTFLGGNMKKSFLVLFLLLGISVLQSQIMIIDHTCTDISQIPTTVIDDVQSDIKWHYAHTSHGEQLTYGLQFLEGDDPSLAFEVGDSYLPNVANSLCIFDGQETDTYITPDLYWETSYGLGLTQNVLNNNSTINVSQWCFCTQCNYYNSTQIQDYLDAMAGLEAANPGVTFVYMTGNAQTDGAEGYNRFLRNEQIRDYCIANNKVLFDFADLDCWHNGVMNSYEYNSTTVPLQHPDFDGDYYGHTTASSCEQKGRAVWWMMARLTDWTPAPPSGFSVTPSAIDFGEINIEETDSEIFTIENVDTVPVTIDQILSDDPAFTLVDLDASLDARLSDFTLPVGGTRDIEVTFSPSAVQTYSGTITIYSTQCGNSTVSVSGEGTDSPSGGYHVCGDVDGVWNYDLIYVDCDLQIPEGYTLMIDPPAGGTDIIFTGHYQFSVAGTLIINGTEEDSVRFKAQNPTTGWHGLRFYNVFYGQDSSMIRYTSFQDGNANGSGWEYGFGGAIFLYESTNLLIENCLFENNSANDGGGGIHVRYSSPTIRNCIFRQNSATNGGGIHFTGSNGNLEYCLINDNTATLGAGIFIDECNPEIVYCEISGNTATLGAGIYIDACSPEIINCTISENTATTNGGAIVLYYWSYPTITNCILWNDSPNEIHVLVNGGTPDPTYSDIDGAWAGTGNINSDPLFENPSNFDFALTASSPCIDTGSPASPLDPDGTRNDMGALYYDQNALSAPSNVTIIHSSGIVTIDWDSVSGATSYNVYSDPNPYGTFSNFEQSGIVITEWSEVVSGNGKFYRVTAEN